MPRLAVLWDYGAISLVEIARAAADLTELVFVIDSTTPYGVTSANLAAELGSVVDGTTSDESLVQSLRACDGIATFSDSQLVRTARCARMLRLPQHEESTARALTNKFLQRTQMMNRGLETPRFVLLQRSSTSDDIMILAREIDYPLIIKPCLGTASRSTYRVVDEGQLASVAAMLCYGTGQLEEDFLAEQMWLGVSRPFPFGDYVSVETVSIDGFHEHIGVSDRLPLQAPMRELGMVVPARIGPGEREVLIHAAHRALSALNVKWGVTHTEIKLTADGPRIIEVNGRLGGFVDSLYRRAGVGEIARMALACALRLPIDAPLDASRTAMSVLFPMPTSGPPDRRELIKSAAMLRGLPGVWRVETPVASLGGKTVQDGTMSSPLIVWMEMDDSPGEISGYLSRVFRAVKHLFGDLMVSRGDEVPTL